MNLLPPADGADGELNQHSAPRTPVVLGTGPEHGVLPGILNPNLRNAAGPASLCGRPDIQGQSESPPTTSPPPKIDRWAHRRAEPRPLALLWTAFLAFATISALAALASHGATSYESYRPAARSLLTVIAAGLTILWPMLRLSQTPAREPVSSWITKDLFVLLMPAQAVIWPQSFFFLAKWPVPVVGALACMLAAWTILIGAVLAFAARLIAESPARPGVRFRAMLVVIAVVVLGPMASFPAHALRPRDPNAAAFDAWKMTSPFTSIFELSADRYWSGFAGEVSTRHWWSIAAVAGLGTCAWLGYAVWSRRRQIRDPFASPLAAPPDHA